MGITSKQKPRLTSNSQNSLSTHSDHSGVRSTPSPTRRISCPLHQWSVSGGSGGSGGVSPSSRTSTPQFGGAVKQRKSSVLLALHVRHRGDQQFETAVTFPETGRYEVHITLHEQHVGGSPLKVLIKSRNDGLLQSNVLLRFTLTCLKLLLSLQFPILRDSSESATKLIINLS